MAGPNCLLRRHPAPTSVVIPVVSKIASLRSIVEISVVPLLIVIEFPIIGAILTRPIKIAIALLRSSASIVRASLGVIHVAAIIKVPASLAVIDVTVGLRISLLRRAPVCRATLRSGKVLFWSLCVPHQIKRVGTSAAVAVFNAHRCCAPIARVLDQLLPSAAIHRHKTKVSWSGHRAGALKAAPLRWLPTQIPHRAHVSEDLNLSGTSTTTSTVHLPWLGSPEPTTLAGLFKFCAVVDEVSAASTITKVQADSKNL